MRLDLLTVDPGHGIEGYTRVAVLVWLVGALGAAAIGLIDYVSGIELSVVQLYYAPISFVAWHRGRAAALTVSTLSTLAWVSSNSIGGLRFSYPALWILNSAVLWISFATVGVLIAILRKALSRAHGLSRTDSLTSVLNSRAFYEHAGRLLALCRRTGRPITMAYVDVDDFKTINEKYGHRTGDNVLKSVAELLQRAVRPSDLVARLGGDTFALMLPEVGPQAAAATLERLRTWFASIGRSSPCPITVSIGGITFATAPDDIEAMVHQVAHMHAAKALGKNRVHFEELPRAH